MTDWEMDCMEFHGEILRGEKCHWCPDWDDLPIDETCEEFKHCHCYEGDEK